ncbi:unnamed protein product, partial [Symbiodinium natans]
VKMDWLLQRANRIASYEGSLDLFVNMEWNQAGTTWQVLNSKELIMDDWYPQANTARLCISARVTVPSNFDASSVRHLHVRLKASDSAETFGWRASSDGVIQNMCGYWSWFACTADDPCKVEARHAVEAAV